MTIQQLNQAAQPMPNPPPCQVKLILESGRYLCPLSDPHSVAKPITQAVGHGYLAAAVIAIAAVFLVSYVIRKK